MGPKLRNKILTSPFLWIGILLFAFILLFSYRKSQQLERDTERNIQLMVRNISSSNIDIAKRIFDNYQEQLEYISLWGFESDDNLNYFIEKDSIFKNVSLLELPDNETILESKIYIDDSCKNIHYLQSLNQNGKRQYLSLEIPLYKLHDIIAENISFSYSYITVIKDGVYIYHPDEHKIGSLQDTSEIVLFNKSQEKLIQNIYSDYLNIPVYRYYTSIDMGGEEWYFTSNTPAISFGELISDAKNTFLYISLSASLAFALIFIIGLLQWKREFLRKQSLLNDKVKLELQNEQNKKQIIATELEQLKSGLNPHFLFNSLSSLRILVTKQPDEAKLFATSLSNIYRYLLNQQNVDTVFLKDELKFTNDYIYLQKIRFGDRIIVDIDIDDNALEQKVPPISLQILVENCIKHTKMTPASPLNIKINTDNNFIIVTNNYNPIELNQPSGIGLDNLTKRYSYLTSKACSFEVQNNEFVSKIPLL